MHFLTLMPAIIGLTAAMPAFNFDFLFQRDQTTTVTDPGPVSDMIVDMFTTLNGTYTGPPLPSNATAQSDMATLHHEDFKTLSTLSSSVPLTFKSSAGNVVNAYFVGICPNGAVCFIRGDNSVVYPSSHGSRTPVSVDSSSVRISISSRGTHSFRLPSQITSARIYFADGDLKFGMVNTGSGDGLVQPAPSNPSDPSANVKWGFVEMNIGSDGTIYANLSYVDFIGVALGMQMQDYNGPTQTARGVRGNSVVSVCSDLRAQGARDGYPWGKTCMTNTHGSVVRVLSPNSYTSLNPSGFANYWSSYVNSVWSHYSSRSLNLHTSCRTSGSTMTCSGGDSGSYQKPSAADIWGCNSGPFTNAGNSVHLANLAMLCAAFHRTTLLSSGGDRQPMSSGNYYKSSPTNYYSKSIHSHELDGKGYAFPYDDVTLGNENTSGTVSSSRPKSLLIWVGGN